MSKQGVKMPLLNPGTVNSARADSSSVGINYTKPKSNEQRPECGNKTINAESLKCKWNSLNVMLFCPKRISLTYK